MTASEGFSTPAALRRSVADDCIFCRIAKGSIPSHKLYEDDATFVFLDIHPLAEGHALAIPKRHAERFEDLDPATVAGLWQAVHRVSPPLLKAVGAAATTLAVNNGRDAGQEVPHVHVHVVPRKPGDGGGPLHAWAWPRPVMAADALARLAATVRTAVPVPGRPAPA